jgi:hypothetical protein
MKTPYRTDRDALEERLASLEKELAAARADVAELEAARAKKHELEREIADVTEKLVRARRMPALESLQIASPCDAAWSDMKGDERVRFCGSCEKNVYDLSKMTRAEAERLLAEKESPCVRLYRRRDGTVLTSDCPVGRKRKRLKRVIALSIGGGLLAAGAMFARWRAASCAITVTAGGPVPMMSATAPPPDMKMGKIAVEPADAPPPPAPKTSR